MKDSKKRTTSSHWGAFNVTTQNDRIVSVDAFENDPSPSSISTVLPQAVHHSSRVARPSIRKSWLEQGPLHAESRLLRGKEDFVELNWDEALDITANEINRVRQTHGNESIFGGSYGWASAGRFHHALGQVHRFLNCAGGYVSSVASYSTAAAQAIIPHVLGMHFLKLMWGEINSWSTIAEHTETLVMFGGINPKNAQVSMGGVTHHETIGWFEEFTKRGIRRINISPQRTDTPDGADWIPIKPGTDTAMMLALAFVIDKLDLLDKTFIERNTIGYETFREYLVGKSDGVPKTPEWASDLCGIDATVIHELAVTLTKTRSLITVSWSLQRAEHGEQPYWMAATLAAMVGQIGLPGGGIGYGYGAIGGIGVSVKRLGGLTFPQLNNPVSSFIPVARIADMLLHPGEPFNFNGQSLTYPDIKLVYWCGGNPFHHHQDLHRLDRAWQRPETIIVNEPWWTATAKRADIVFPATTPYERHDIARAQGDSYLFDMPALIPPVGEARDDYDIFAALAERLGVGEQFTEGRDSESWLRFLYDNFRSQSAQQGVDVPAYDELQKRNWVDLPLRNSKFAETPFADFRQDPIANPLSTPSGKIEIFSSTISQFGYDDCPGHPTWLPPTEWLGAATAKDFPLHLVSPQPGDKLHSQMESAIADIPGERPTPISISPQDATQRSISDGSLVRVFNQRGACIAKAHVSNDIMPGVVSLPTGAWFTPDDNGTETQGNPNTLTKDTGTSQLGQGSSAHSCLVEVCAEKV
ncbi:MAG: molybdopterin-dependent oxidoreductase [Gammaproteobacteria bacterium]|nr:molybdopterin-dependent oxidoreductase [Gammaproteobacteria bacterium]